MISLSRLDITGAINRNTPVCVLLEIADAHGISYDLSETENARFVTSLSDMISYSPRLTASEGDRGRWSMIARFINKDCAWPSGKLKTAFVFLSQFSQSTDPTTKIPFPFEPGSQTPSNPNKINACVLYGACFYHGIRVHRETTIEEMANAVRMLREPTESLENKARIFIERNASKKDLIGILLGSAGNKHVEETLGASVKNYRQSPTVDCVSYSSLEKLYENVNNVRILRENVDPRTAGAAVALAALNFKIDISRTVSPVKEYKVLKMAGRSYVPQDDWMKYWYEINPSIFDLSSTFNPNFPPSFYTKERLEQMAKAEGFTHRELRDEGHYELLQTAYLSETFHQGEIPNTQATQTPVDIWTPEEVPYGELLSYGPIESPIGIISISELVAGFRENQNFSSCFAPHANFSSTSISKLKVIARGDTGAIPGRKISRETRRVRENLFEAISCVESITTSGDNATRNFVLNYSNASNEIKNLSARMLKTLLYLGMSMRGWDGESEYPISRAEVPDNREAQVFVNVTDYIAKYKQERGALGSMGKMIDSLPLVLYKDGDFRVSSNENEGLTIGQRINIVIEGDKTSRLTSCIRLSSNWLCSSAHRYMTAIGLQEPFDIFCLRYIA